MNDQTQSDQTQPDQTHKGRCMCGAVQIEAIGDPLWTATCHCKSCRHATGAAMSIFAGYAKASTRVLGDAYLEYESSPGVLRGFCTKCGTRLSCGGDRWPGEYHIHTGVMENADALAPAANVYVKDKLDWVVLEPDLPAFQTTPRQES